MDGSCAADLVLCTQTWSSYAQFLVLAEPFGPLAAGTRMAVIAMTAVGWAQAQRHPFEALWVPADFLELPEGGEWGGLRWRWNFRSATSDPWQDAARVSQPAGQPVSLSIYLSTYRSIYPTN